MTSPTTPAEVAKRLTKAQQRAILAMTERWQRASRSTFSDGAAWGAYWSYSQTGVELIDKREVGPSEHRRRREYALLPAGLAVKALLLEQGNGGGDA